MKSKNRRISLVYGKYCVITMNAAELLITWKQRRGWKVNKLRNIGGRKTDRDKKKTVHREREWMCGRGGGILIDGRYKREREGSGAGSER